MEISQSIFLFKINLAFYKYDADSNSYKIQLFYKLNDINIINNPLLILLYDDSIQHYQIIQYNESSTIKLNIKEKELNKLNNDIKKEKKIFIKEIR